MEALALKGRCHSEVEVVCLYSTIITILRFWCLWPVRREFLHPVQVSGLICHTPLDLDHVTSPYSMSVGTLRYGANILT
jgi:hypothetical protein